MSDNHNEDMEEFITQDEYDALSEEDKSGFVIAEKVTASDYEKEYEKRYYTPATGTRGEKKQKVAAAKHLARRGRGQATHRGYGTTPDPKNRMRIHEPYTIGAGPKGKLPESVEYEIDESVASETLKANSRPAGEDPKSKVEFMQRALGAMHAMKKEDLSKWYHQAMALIGKEADSLPAGANAGSNQSSIDMKTGKGPKTKDAMPKISVKEDVEEMFVGEDLSEEFKDKATTLFEAAVNAKVTAELARLEEQFEESLQESVVLAVETIEKNLDTYLDYVVEKWMEENQVAVESSLRNEIMEEFIGGLKNLFQEHYIEVPEEKVDVIEALASKVEQLEGSLSEAIEENVELKSVLQESKRQEVVGSLAEGLTMTQAEKFFALAEGIEFDGDLDTYARKLSLVKENYFVKSAAKSNLEEETFEVETQTTTNVDPSVNRYVQAISRTVKK